MWTSMNDVYSDLSKLNDFGDCRNSERYEDLCSKERIRKSTNKTPDIPEILDPRTGEAITICIENKKKGGKEFGFNSPAMETLRYEHELHNQLQLVRKMRPCDQQVEDYFNKKICSSSSNTCSDKSRVESRKVERDDDLTDKPVDTKKNKISYSEAECGSVQDELSEMESTKNKGARSKWCENTPSTKMPRTDRNVLISTLLARSAQLKEAKKNEKRKKSLQMVQ